MTKARCLKKLQKYFLILAKIAIKLGPSYLTIAYKIILQKTSSSYKITNICLWCSAICTQNMYFKCREVFTILFCLYKFIL